MYIWREFFPFLKAHIPCRRRRGQINISSSSSSHDCPTQGLVIHCKRRNQGCSSAEGRSSTANLGTKAAVLTGMNRCFALLSAPHSLFSIWTDLKRYERISGAPTWRWGEWIWLTGPSGFHRNSPQGLNINSIRVYDQIRDPDIPITLIKHLCIHNLEVHENLHSFARTTKKTML